MTYRRAQVLITAILVFFAVSAQASATTRYAVPGGSSSDATCVSLSAQCSLRHVLEDVILTADDVVVMPGTYDLGTNGVSVRSGSNSVSIHGAEGQPRPTITADSASAVFQLCLSSCPADLSTIRHLKFENTGTGSALLFYGGSAGNPVSIDDVEAVAGTNSSSWAILGWAQASGASEVTIRNTVAYAPNSGPNGGAIGTEMNLAMRNVTAFAPGGTALLQMAMCDVGSCIANASGQVFNSILAGGADVKTTGNGLYFGTASLDYSNYDTIVNCTGCSVSAVGSNHNQSAPPLLAGGSDFHQQPGSPTIDAGVDAVANGSADPDGNPRKLGAATDIGAFEDGHPRATTDAATNVTASGATLHGSVNPLGFATTYYFDWGTTTAYGNRIPATALSAGSGADAQPVAQDLTGLAPGTTVHYRLVAENSFGPAAGADRSFTTVAPDSGSAPQPGSAPIAAPATQFTFGGVRLTARSVIAKRGRYVLLPIRCPAGVAGNCVGKVTLTASSSTKKKLVLGSASFSIRSGATKSVKVQLSRTARKLLTAKRSVQALATLTATASGQKKSRAQKLTVKLPRQFSTK